MHVSAILPNKCKQQTNNKHCLHAALKERALSHDFYMLQFYVCWLLPIQHLLPGIICLQYSRPLRKICMPTYCFFDAVTLKGTKMLFPLAQTTGTLCAFMISGNSNSKA